MKATQNPTFWFVFIPAVIVLSAPWFIFASLIVRARIAIWKTYPKALPVWPISERFRRVRELQEQYPHLAELRRKAWKWLMITFVTWFLAFAVFFAVAIVAVAVTHFR